jgi:hypothetical protein
MTQGHISLSISPFLVISANTSKATQHIQMRAKKCTSMSILKPIKLLQDLAYLDHFATTWLIFTKHIQFPISMSKHFVLANQNIFKISFDQKARNSPFSHNHISPPQERVFAIRGF